MGEQRQRNLHLHKPQTRLTVAAFLGPGGFSGIHLFAVCLETLKNRQVFTESPFDRQNN